MKRRAFLGALAASAATWPFSARGYPLTVRIGYLGPDPADADPGHYDALVEGLTELGYVDGQSVEIIVRHPSRFGANLVALARELVDHDADVIVTGGPGVFAAAQATKTVPIVAGVSGDLVELGLAQSLAHPGGNVTGLTYFAPQLIVKRVELLKLAKPSMTKVGLLVLPNIPSVQGYLRALDEPLKALGLAVLVIEASDSGEVANALKTGPAASINGLIVSDYPPFNAGVGPTVVAVAAMSHGLPSIGGLTFAKNGGLLSYGVDFPSMFHRAATFVDKIIRGIQPGEIPIEQATQFLTVVNLQTAQKLDLEIPQDLLAGADQVIE